ncbi:DsbA-like protein [Necator americanus]|uniref:Glutathione S-transferase kappa n=1 Tax=Necator americanus TaxID=51031 RepID=W2SG58_NECAM|nr:DsbA-like protein [Necator americanus]ETN68585.1 DsbA-like protein [Necator americanus]
MCSRIAVDLFFDVFSPYSWIGFEGLMRYQKVWPISVRLRPFYFAGIIKATKNNGAPLMLAEKESYMDLDLKRNSTYWGVPVSLPMNFKNLVFTKSSANAQRLLIALQKEQPSLLEEAARLMWIRTFTHHIGVFHKEDLMEIMSDLEIENPTALLELASSHDVKDALKINTSEALDMGCFGAPWIHVHTPSGKIEPFFGSDRLPLIGHLIGEPYEGPLNHLAEHHSSLTELK